LSDFEVRPRFTIGAGREHCADGIEFGFRDRQEILPYTNNGVHARDGQDGEPVVHIEPAENVSGKERKFDLFHAVGPAIGPTIERQEFFVSFAAQIPRDDFLKARPYVERIPERAFLGKVHLNFPQV
jgi:hypothetical protein